MDSSHSEDKHPTHSHANPWDRMQSVATVIASVLIPVVIAIVGNAYADAIKEREVQGRFVELAVEILNEPDTTDSRRGIREWAVDILGEYSGVSFPDSVETQLRNAGEPLTERRTPTLTSDFVVVSVGDAPVALSLTVEGEATARSIVSTGEDTFESGNEGFRRLNLGTGTELEGQILDITTTVANTSSRAADVDFTLTIESGGSVSKQYSRALSIQKAGIQIIALQLYLVKDT